MSAFINISAYKFVHLDDLPALQERLLSVCLAGRLKGTILLSAEGINLFVSGERTELELLLSHLHAISGLNDLAFKESESAEQPFNRMLVKIKKEIIAFGIEGIDPAGKPTPKLNPATLKEWLDEGRPLTLLDTRNEYEVRMGTFRGAIHTGIEHFRKFPEAVKQLPEELKAQPVVMFCTGGIRCEKAGPFLEMEGFQQVYQLEGGILKYFEECGGAHYDGECFVFDRRVGVDSNLQETNSVMCFTCQMPLTFEQQRHPHYVREQSCPYCFGRGAASG